MTITVTAGTTSGSSIIGGGVGGFTGSPPLPSLADGDMLIIFGWGATQVTDTSGHFVRFGTPAGTLANTGWSISGSGWTEICDEIGLTSPFNGRKSRLFAARRMCDGTETSFTVTADGPDQGWDNSTVVGAGLKVGAIRVRSSSGIPRIVAGPVASSTATTNSAWQPSGVTANGVGLALLAGPLNAPTTGWLAWGGASAPRGGSATSTASGAWLPPTEDVNTGTGDHPTVASMAFSDTATQWRLDRLQWGAQAGVGFS